MKKIFTFLIAFFSITSIFAQSRNWNNNTNDRHQSANTYGQSTYDNHNAYDNHSSYDNHNYGQPAYNNHDNDKRWNNDRNAGYDNRNSGYDNHSSGYDNRNSGYDNRYDNYGHHSVNTYDVRRNAPVYNHRDDRYYGREPQRSGSTLKTVGAGLIVGGIIALMAGSH